MHRGTGAGNGFRAYSGGGGRVLISEVHDDQTMQAMNGSGMKGEAFSGSKDGKFKGPESPQNYGFTSVVADAKKGKDGQIEASAEGFMSFMGGNRSFPVCSMMDDRRHRLNNLGKDAAKGAVALHGMKEWGQQFLNTEDGMHMTGNNKKKIRISLVDNKNDKKSPKDATGKATGSGRAATHFVSPSGVEFVYADARFTDNDPSVSALADGGGDSGGGGGDAGGGKEGKEKPTGQKTLHKEETEIQIEQNGQVTTSQHGQFYTAQKGGSDASVYHKDRKHSSQATDEHVHMRFEKNKIWVDKDGHWSELPILQKKDQYCKE